MLDFYWLVLKLLKTKDIISEYTRIKELSKEARTIVKGKTLTVLDINTFG